MKLHVCQFALGTDSLAEIPADLDSANTLVLVFGPSSLLDTPETMARISSMFSRSWTPP